MPVKQQKEAVTAPLNTISVLLMYQASFSVSLVFSKKKKKPMTFAALPG